ncbi:MAG TPA: CRTAC1 family protein [Kiritimatiellia bacterium]|nr:CRTAC1 family protein [Kiritimatiellia bacterium]HMP35296.1 CRTAC1 family protein [Kiritimatiellia bacterium]
MRLLAAIGLAVLCTAGSTRAQAWFTEVTTNAGITHLFTRPTGGITGSAALDFFEQTGGAVAEDFDGDGWIDLFVLQAGTNANLLYRNRGDGTFTNEAVPRGAAQVWQSIGAAAADYDNNGTVDIVFTAMTNQPVLLVNTGGGYFVFTTLTNSKVEVDTDEEFGVFTNYTEIFRQTSPSWGDVDRDGQLDLAFGRWYGQRPSLEFYHNQGGQLVEAMRWDDEPDFYVFTPFFADFNGDRWPEMGSVADFTNTYLFANSRTGYLERVTRTFAGYGTDENGMGTAVGDIDNDGDLDWFVTSIRDTSPPPGVKWNGSGNRLFRNEGGLRFSDITSAAGVRDGYWGWGAVMGDLDNDGWLDLFHVNGYANTFFSWIPEKFNDKPALLFRNRGDGTFTNIAAEAGLADTGQGRGTLLFDYDNDGDLDVFIVNNQALTAVGTNAVRTPGPPRLYRNDNTNGYGWLKVTLDGVPPLHRHGIGSRVYLTAGGMTQMRELNASSGYLAHGPNRIAHFGLGTNTVIDAVRAEWINGDAVVVRNVAINQAMSVGVPRAVVSTNYLYGAGSVTGSATNVTPLGTPRWWVVNGVTNSDPVTASFNQAGTQEMVLHVTDASWTNVVWTEIRRVLVETAELQLLSGPGPVWSVQWAARSGFVYRVQAATNGVGAWTSISAVTTAVVTEAVTGVVTAEAASAAFRLVEQPVP